MIAYEQRASTVLANLIAAQPGNGPFLLPENVCPIVLLVLLKLGRAFELIDIPPRSLCVDHSRILDRWSEPSLPAPAGLVYVRTYGFLEDVADFYSRLKSLRPESLLIDDRCLCAPNFAAPRSEDADAILYSTGYGKIVDVGFGGYAFLKPDVRYEPRSARFDAAGLTAVTTNYKDALATGRTLQYTDSDWLDFRDPPMRWDDYRHAVESECATSLDRKRAINQIYAEGLPKRIQFPAAFQSWRFNLNIADKSRVLNAIQAAGLFASGHYDSLAVLFGQRPGAVAISLHAHVVNLFNDKHFDIGRAHLLVERLRSEDSLLVPGFEFEPDMG